MQPAYELATILNLHWERANELLQLNGWQWRTLHAIRRCRTAALGGHIDQCDSCGHLRMSYNSCRNRNCPKCQGQQQEAWMAATPEAINHWHCINRLLFMVYYSPLPGAPSVFCIKS